MKIKTLIAELSKLDKEQEVVVCADNQFAVYENVCRILTDKAMYLNRGTIVDVDMAEDSINGGDAVKCIALITD